MAEERKFYFEHAGVYIAEGDTPLGFGRYGEVWAAHSDNGNTRRAVKITAEKYKSVLQTEFDNLKILEKVDEDGLIVRGYEIGHTGDARPCMLMELIEAKPLKSLADELRQRLGPEVAWTLEDEKLRIKISAQIANAIYTAFKAGIALTDLKIDNFFYSEDWRQLVKVIDWNLVDVQTPHDSFVEDTLPKLGDVFYEIFTGLTLREQRQEGQLGNINKDFFTKTRPGQTWPMYWDQVTFGTRNIIRDMIFSGFTGDNQPLDLWSRWTTRRRILVDRVGLDEYLGIESADLSGKLDLEKTSDEMLEIYSVLQINSPNKHRERELREWVHRKLARLITEQDFVQAYTYLLSARRMYTGSLRLDFWLLFIILGLTAKSNSLYIEQIQDLPEKMERHWKRNEFEQLINMLIRIEGKVKSYWPSASEIPGIIERLSVIIGFLRELEGLEDLLTGENLEDFHRIGSKVFKQISLHPWLEPYLKDAENIPPPFHTLLTQLEEIYTLYSEFKRTFAKDVEFELYQYVLSSKWHNTSIIPLYESYLDYLNKQKKHSIAENLFRVDKFRQDVGHLEKKINAATNEISPIINSFPDLEQKKDQIWKSIEYLTLQIKTQENELSKLTDSMSKLDDSKNRLVSNTSKGYSHFNEISSLQKKMDKFAADMEDNLKSLNAKYQVLGSNTEEVNKKISVLEKKKENILDQAEVLEKKIARVYEKIERTDESTLEIENRINELKGKQLAILSQTKQVESEFIHLDETHSHLGLHFDNVHKHVEQLVALEQKVSKQINKLDDRLKEVEQKKSDLTVVESNLHDFQLIQEKLIAKTDYIYQDFDRMDRGYINLSSQSDKLRATISEAEKNSQELDERIRNVRLRQIRQRLLLKRLKRTKFPWQERISHFSEKLILFSKRREENEKARKYDLVWVKRVGAVVLIVIFAFSAYEFSSPSRRTAIVQFAQGHDATTAPTPIFTQAGIIPSLVVQSVANSTAKPILTTMTASPIPFTPTVTKTLTPSATTINVTPTGASFSTALTSIEVFIKNTSVYLKTSDEENALNAQWINGALEFGQGEKLVAVGRNQDGEWLLLSINDDQGKLWLGWAEKASLNSIDEANVNSLSPIVTCTAKDNLPLFDLPAGDPQESYVNRNVVYLGMFRAVDEKNLEWVQLGNGLLNGWIRRDNINCSADILSLPEFKK